jgi:cysteine sulfinate desulfinase/cysteine desulfurase-like protein
VKKASFYGVYQFWYILFGKLKLNSYLCRKTKIMAVLNFTSREFRSQQAHVFDLADQGEKIVIRRSKKQAYTLVPVEDEDITFTKSLEERIGMALQEVKQMRDGKIKELSMNDLLDEL